jgi:predicted amidohydrolase
MIKAGQRPFRRDKQDIRALGRMLTGSNPDNEFAGHSLIIDPWGRILAEGDRTEGAVRAVFLSTFF